MKRVLFPKTRLSELAARPGGVARDAAIEGATEQLQSMRDESNAIIENTIAGIEAIACKGARLSDEDMRAILIGADQVVTLAGTFGYGTLDTVARSLCDVTDGLMRAGIDAAAPIAVHARALRLFAPGHAELPQSERDKVLGELAKVLAHFNLAPLGNHDADDAAAG
jgi:hypothetical protein